MLFHLTVIKEQWPRKCNDLQVKRYSESLGTHLFSLYFSIFPVLASRFEATYGSEDEEGVWGLCPPLVVSYRSVTYLTFLFAPLYLPYLSILVFCYPHSAALTFCLPMCPHVTLIYCFSPFVPLSFSMCLQSADSCLYFPNPPSWDFICCFFSFVSLSFPLWLLALPLYIFLLLSPSGTRRRSWLIGRMTLWWERWGSFQEWGDWFFVWR